MTDKSRLRPVPPPDDSKRCGGCGLRDFTPCKCVCASHSPETAEFLNDTPTGCNKCCEHTIYKCGHCSTLQCPCAAIEQHNKKPSKRKRCENCGEVYGDSGSLAYKQCDCCSDTLSCVNCCRIHDHRCCSRIDMTERRATLFAFPTYPNTPYYVASVANDLHIGMTSAKESLRLFSTDKRSRKLVNPKGFRKNGSSRFAATEIEVATVSLGKAAELRKALERWGCAVVHDGTTGPGGFEINSTPACGDVLLQQITELGSGLATAKATVHDRCGLHVHVDARDFGYQEIQKLVKVYHQIEESLFAAMHWTRYQNDYCRHCGQKYYDRFVLGVKPDTKGIKKHVINTIYGLGGEHEQIALEQNGLVRRGAVRAQRWGDPPPAAPAFVAAPSIDTEEGFDRFQLARRDHHGSHLTRHRYNALNLHTYFHRGTVEFRLHHASTLGSEIYNWMRIIIDMFDFIAGVRGRELESILEVSSYDMEQALCMLGPINRPELQKVLVGNGVAIMSRILLPESWLDFVEKIQYNVREAHCAIPSMVPGVYGREV